MSMSTNWCFTVNNFTDTDRKFFEDYSCPFIIFGEEIAPNTGTRHLQGFIQLDKRKRLTGVKKIHATAHWEITKGTIADNITYCSKGENIYRRGEPSYPGKRNDLNLFVQESKKRRLTEDELLETYPSVVARYPHFVERVANHYNPPIDHADYPLRYPAQTDFTRLIVLEGAPGIGKTQYALAHFQKPKLISCLEDLKKFNPAVHDGLVFDDIDFEALGRPIQIYLSDWEHARTIDVKYGSVTIPKHTPKFLCTNFLNITDGAVTRRILKINCDKFFV